MNTKEHGKPGPNTPLILAVDLGGTNAGFAHVEPRNGEFLILDRVVLPSAEQTGFVDALKKALTELQHCAGEPREIHACCVSAAGPVANGRCVPTNLPYHVDAQEIELVLQVPSRVINDFEAICYGVPLLDLNDPEHVLSIPIPGAHAVPRPGVSAVLGAGTGLGMGYLYHSASTLLVHASEGGHLDFAPWDEQSRQVAAHLKQELGRYPDREHALSGRALPRLYRFVLAEASKHKALEGTEARTSAGILELPSDDQPAAIATAADHDELCAQTMQIFFGIYGRQCAGAALQFLPDYGVFLAGGATAKNAEALSTSTAFANAYLQGYDGAMREHLLSTPLYIIRDYRISLRGAAYAALKRLEGAKYL